MELKLRVVSLVYTSSGNHYTFVGDVYDADRKQGTFNFWAREVKSFWSNVSHRDSFELWETSSATKGKCLLLGAENNGDGFSTSGVPSAKARIVISARSILIHKYNNDGTLVKNHSANCLIPTPSLLSIDSVKRLSQGARLNLGAAGRTELDKLLALSPRTLSVKNSVKESRRLHALREKYPLELAVKWSEHENDFVLA